MQLDAFTDDGFQGGTRAGDGFRWLAIADDVDGLIRLKRFCTGTRTVIKLLLFLAIQVHDLFSMIDHHGKMLPDARFQDI